MPEIGYITIEEAAQLIQQLPDSDTKISMQQNLDSFAAFVEEGISKIALYEGDTVLSYLDVREDMIIVSGNLTVTGTLEDCLEVPLSLLVVFGNVVAEHLFTFSQICIGGNLTVEHILLGDSNCIYSLDVRGDLRARMIFEEHHWFDIKGIVTADKIYAQHSKAPRGVLQPNLEDGDLPDELTFMGHMDQGNIMVALRDNSSDFLKAAIMRIKIWPFIMEFIRKQDPVFRSQCKGLSDKEIALLPAGLPASYVEFLRMMGVHSNGHSMFGSLYDHRFASIIEHIAEYDEDAPPLHRYFPVAIETDESMITSYTLYLDLKHSDGEDAPLIMLEDGVAFALQKPRDTGYTFNERMTGNVFSYFQLHHYKEQDVIAIGGVSLAGEGGVALQQALELLQRMQFEIVLPLLGHVACLKTKSIRILARVNKEAEMLTMQLGSDDPEALKKLAEHLLVELPGARRPHKPRLNDE